MAFRHSGLTGRQPGNTMTWIQHHRTSEAHASEAEARVRLGKREDARALYALAAVAEEQALEALDLSKARTYGITAVSATSLYFKAGQLDCAERIALASMAFDQLPAFARHQLQHIMQVVWTEQRRQASGLRFVPGQLMVSVSGGQVVAGGAPLQPILDKVKTIESMHCRTVEFLSDTAFRTRGPPSKRIRENYQAWLFQAPPGSYQFAVAIQQDDNEEMFDSRGETVADFLFKVLRLGSDGSDEDFSGVVPDARYRETFLKLARNLAPSGKVFDALEVRSADDSQSVKLDQEVRRRLGERIRGLGKANVDATTRRQAHTGVLRAVHLDKDWLEVAVEGRHVKVVGVGEQVDDVIGPLVNKRVLVHVDSDGEKHRFVDIEPDE